MSNMVVIVSVVGTLLVAFSVVLFANMNMDKLAGILLEVLAMSKRQASAESSARKTLRTLLAIKKKEVKELNEQLDEYETELAEVWDSDEDDSSEGEEEEKDDEEASRRRRKSPDKIALLSIALQRRMRLARDIVQSAIDSNSVVDLEGLSKILDTDLNKFEKEMNSES